MNKLGDISKVQSQIWRTFLKFHAKKITVVVPMAIMCFCIWYFEGIQWQPCAQEKIVWATASKLLFPLHLTSANLPVIAITRHTLLPHTISMMYQYGLTYCQLKHSTLLKNQQINHRPQRHIALVNASQCQNIHHHRPGAHQTFKHFQRHNKG